MPPRLLIISIMLLVGGSVDPLPLAAQFPDALSAQPEAIHRVSASHPAPKSITPRTRGGSTKAEQADEKASSAGSVWTTIGSLAVVVFLILIIARSWKKHGSRIGGQIPSEAVELLGKKHIDARQSLHLVRLGSRILLLGSSTGGLRTLAEITDPVDVDFLAGVCRQTMADGAVSQTFRALFNRRSSPDQSPSRQPQPADRPEERPARAKSDAPRFHRPDLEEVRG
ncbi:MAG: flagellar biosynthetic protein FliO [Planctomycetaceae bacterium]